MPKIAIIYYSTYGHVKKLADKVRAGAESAGVEVDMFQVPETLDAAALTAMGAPPKPSDPLMDRQATARLPDYDGFVFGMPTRFGMMAHQMKSFFDGTGGLWASGRLTGKPATMFVSTGTQNGGQETTHLTAVTQLVHHGMVYVPLGYPEDVSSVTDDAVVHGCSPYGASTHAGPDNSRQPSEQELAVAEVQGRRFARVAVDMGEPSPAAFSKLMHARYSCKAFDARPVPEDVLARVMELTQRACTSFNTQPWVAVLVKSPEAKKKLVPAMFEGNVSKMESAPLSVVFAGDMEAGKLLGDDVPDFVKQALPTCIAHSSPEAWAFKQSMMAVATFLLACQACGLSTNCMEGFTSPQAVKDAVGLTDRYCVPCVVSVGYEKEPRKHVTDRYPSSNVWFREKFKPAGVFNTQVDGARGKGAAPPMKAVLHTAYGELGTTLTVGTCPIPEFDPESATLLVKVHAAAINPIDYKVMLGHMKPYLGELKHFPRVPGCDVSGVVVKAGAACKWAKPGDRIFADWPGNCRGLGSGTLAEYTVMPEAYASIAPANLSFVQAAAIPLAGLTAYQALRHQGGLEKGMKVLVLGGSGGTGTFALSCAKNLGAAHVATTSSSVDLCRSLGADQVVNYRQGEDVGEVLAGGDYDVVFDCVGGLDGWEKSKKVMKKGARYVTIAGPPVPPEQHGNFVWKSFFTDTGTEQAAADLAALKEMCESGKMTPVLDPSSPYTLDTAPKAFELLQSQRAKGKLVIQVCTDDDIAVPAGTDLAAVRWVRGVAVPLTLVSGFLDALKAEHVGRSAGAVNAFFDKMAVSSKIREVLAPEQAKVQSSSREKAGAIRSLAERWKVGGVGGGVSNLAAVCWVRGVAVPQTLASGFLDALTAEHVNRSAGAVSAFFDKMAVTSEMREVLTPEQAKVQSSSDDKADAIRSLSERWKVGGVGGGASASAASASIPALAVTNFAAVRWVRGVAVPLALVSGFLDALKAEHVGRSAGAVNAFFDKMAVSSKIREVLAPEQAKVQSSSDDKAGAIRSLAERWAQPQLVGGARGKEGTYVVFYHSAGKAFTGRAQGILLMLEEAGKEYMCVTPDKYKVEDVFPGFAPPMVRTPSGVTISQTSAIMWLLGKELGLYPTGGHDEETHAMQVTLDSSDYLADALKAHAEGKLADFTAEGGRMQRWLGHAERCAELSKGRFLAGEALTYADFAVLYTFNVLEASVGDPFHELLRQRPKLAAWHKMMQERPRVKAFHDRGVPVVTESMRLPKPYRVFCHTAAKAFTGRAEGILLMLEESGKPYVCREPDAYPGEGGFPGFAPPKVQTPSGETLAQPHAIMWLLGRELGFFPTGGPAEETHALQMSLDSADYFFEAVRARGEGEAERAEFLSGRMAKWLDTVERGVAASSGRFLVGKTVTYADFAVLFALNAVGFALGGPLRAEIAKRQRLATWQKMMLQRPKVKRFYGRGVPIMFPDMKADECSS